MAESKNTTLFKPIRKRSRRSKIHVKGPAQQMQIDLIDFTQLKKANDEISYILVGIDCFTKKNWTYPAKNKSAKEISLVSKSLK